jgi:hypothetical protein
VLQERLPRIIFGPKGDDDVRGCKNYTSRSEIRMRKSR